ncbi:MAG: 2-oxoacid:acceptor oxidoreductase family protein, partial [Planctomycetes bacterium]|nr:2-oxoacid:acceptor oxidoreductase family protein [Planctomycetota bacterium]
LEFNLKTKDAFCTKGATNFNHCKGCFVCASACPTDAIHFVPKENVDYENFSGLPIEPEQVAGIYKDAQNAQNTSAQLLITAARYHLNSATKGPLHQGDNEIFNGSVMLGQFAFQAQFDVATMFPITPNTSLLKYLEDKVKMQDMSADHPMTLRTCLSEESGYAWLTGAVVRGKRALMAQGSQSMAQLFEFLNINPGLHLPVFMMEMTRAIAPGTSIKPDHTTTLRTADTGEIIIFGRCLQDNYDKSILLLKLMESEGIWIPGRLVIKGFVETHSLTSKKQGDLKLLEDATVRDYLGHPENPFVFSEEENVSVGTLDFDARYGEQRQAIDEVLRQAGECFDTVADSLSAVNGRAPLGKVTAYPHGEQADFVVISLNDPDMNTAELVVDELREQGIRAGAVSVNLYRPFPAQEIRDALRDCRAVAIFDYSNQSGRAGGAAFADEVRSALYTMENPPQIFAVQLGLGGRAVTIPYLLLINRMLADLASDKSNSKTHQWLDRHAIDRVISLGNRGNMIPETDANFDVLHKQRGVEQTMVVGKGGQGVLLLNGLLSAVATLRGDYALSMVGYGALQRGGGITLSFKSAQEKIRDYSDIVIADTILSFEDDLHLEAMLPQLADDGTLIIDGVENKLEKYQSMVSPTAQVVVIPAKSIALNLYNDANRTNLILFGALMAHHGVENVQTLLHLLDNFSTIPSIGKETKIIGKEASRIGIIAGFCAYQKAMGFELPQDMVADSESHVETLEHFQQRIMPQKIFDAVGDEKKLNKIKSRYAFKKKFYKLMFQFHPMVSQIQNMYLTLRGKTPISGGDMACGGCGQINIFRDVFNYLYAMQNDKGKIFVSEQDGCGTVFSGMNRTSIWNMPYIRIAFETAHGVAAGLTQDKDDEDIVVSISGDGGMMQGLRSVEDALHHQDPILHLVVINQTLGNTGGQAAATTTVGTKTRDGHIAQHNSINFLKYAEKHHVQGAVASTVNLHDLYQKLKWAHKVIKEERRPFMLVMNFSCLEQGLNLAGSLGMQKTGLEAHYYNLYSLRYKEVKNAQGQVLYYKKRIHIDYYPWTFGKRAWKKKLLEYASQQTMMQPVVDDPEVLEAAYGQLRGQWESLRSDMGFMRYYWGFFKDIFNLSRATMARLIHKDIPDEAK